MEADTHQIHSQIHRYKVYKTADKLVYCHEAMHVQLRMQDAGWSADVWSVGSRMRTLTDQRKKVSTTRWLSLVLLDRHERARAGEGACVGSFRELRYTRYTPVRVNAHFFSAL